ncbi:MAG: glycosyltransferase [Chthoniobacterales bacterium]|nr:glycosyltransferase [Chthoniobacterales bacterium]
MSATVRRVVLVLGMHRSGTSALARALHTLGFGLPDNLLPPAPDNTGGYFESKDLTRLNEEILSAAGTSWHDPSPIVAEWFDSAGASVFRERAKAFVEKALSASPMIVLKDPRLCRLLPFWRACLRNMNVAAGSVLILRDPREVARSLQVRVLTEPTRRGGLLSIARAHWLWLRYVLEAEFGSRGLPRAILTYEMLLADAPRELTAIAERLGFDYPVPLGAATGTLERGLKRQESGGFESLGWPGVAVHFYHQLAAQVARGDEVDRAEVDAFREAFATAAPAAPNEKPIHACSPAYGSALSSLGRAQGTFRQGARVLFVSDSPETRGHLYRVEHHAAALQAGGLEADWCLLDDFDDEELAGLGLVVLFRTPWDVRVAALSAACRARGIRIAFDIDDLVFEPDYMREPYFDYLRTLNPVGRERWAARVAGWRQSLLETDCAIVSTAPLAAALEKLGKQALVWPNGISCRMLEDARRLRDRPVDKGAGVRLGYASGAPTHQKDFAQISAVLAGVLNDRSQASLTIVGYLDLGEFPELTEHAARIETRPVVPHHELGAEYARFDINLAPLEAGNPFCEAKSELKYFEAALLHMPTVASATEPYAAAIQSGVNGFVARDEADWRDHLLALIDDQAARERVGREAFWHAVVRFGPEAQCLGGLSAIGELIADGEPG